MSSENNNLLKVERERFKLLEAKFAKTLGVPQKSQEPLADDGKSDDAFSSEFGKRLRQERERLGLSQAEFARQAGVHRNTQVRYEGGTREADSEYLTGIQRIGVDTGYLFFGKKTDKNSVFSLAAARLLPAVASRVGLSGSALLELLNLVAEDESAVWAGTDYSSISFQLLTDALFENSELLTEVFDAISISQHYLGVSLGYQKRVQIAEIIYSSSRASGNIEPQTVIDSVRLAAS